VKKNTIRSATAEDNEGLKELYVDAFPKGEGEVVSEIAIALTESGTDRDALSFVVDVDNQIIAHVSFSAVKCNEDSSIVSYCLAPLAVRKSLHKTGYGTKIVQYGLDYLKNKNTDVVLVYGDPNYYGRFGFVADLGKNFIVPYELEYDFGWQGLRLSERKISSTQHCTFVTALSDQKYW